MRTSTGLSLGLGLSGALLTAALPVAAPVSSPCRALFGITDRLPDRSCVALTFDDGPHPRGTPLVLDILARAGIRATFFLVGEQVRRRPALVSEMVAQGHEIGLHSYSHTALVRLTPRALEREMDMSASAVGEAAGLSVRLFRPPRGIFTYSGLRQVRDRGWTPVLWAADGRDWRQRATPDGICERVARRLLGGNVILLHDSDFYGAHESWRNTAAALEPLLEQIEQRGLRAAAMTVESLRGAR